MPKWLFKRHLDIFFVLIIVIRVPLLATFGPPGPIRILLIREGNEATIPQICASVTSEVSNELKGSHNYSTAVAHFSLHFCSSE